MKRTHRHTHTIECKSVYRHICDNLDADLNSQKCREIKGHINKCKNCTAYLDSLKKTIFLYRTYPVPAIPVKTEKKLFAAISLEIAKAK